MGDALHAAQAHGQSWLSSIQRLDLCLLIDAEHHRPVRRVQVRADDVPYLLNEERVDRELAAVRLPRSGKASAGVAALRKVCSQR